MSALEEIVAEVAATYGVQQEGVANVARILRDQNPTITDADLKDLLVSVVAPGFRNLLRSLLASSRRGAA